MGWPWETYGHGELDQILATAKANHHLLIANNVLLKRQESIMSALSDVVDRLTAELEALKSSVDALEAKVTSAPPTEDTSADVARLETVAQSLIDMKTGVDEVLTPASTEAPPAA